MADDPVFQARLAAALARYAELAPAMDDEAIIRAAIDAGGRARTGRLDGLRDALFGPMAGSRGMRFVSIVAVLALLLAAILAAVIGGALRNESPPLPGRNGAIVLSISSNAHEAATVATDPDGTGRHPIQAGRCPTHSRDGSALAWLSYAGSAANLVVAAADGSRPHTMLLADSAQQSVSYALSPDGSHVVWFKPVAASPAASPSPDGPATPDPGVELWVAPIDGGEGARIAGASTTPGESSDSPLWSPDGRRIAFVTFVTDDATGERRRTAIEVVAPDGSDRRRLTTRSGLLGDGMSWSPDGRSLAYVAVGDPAASPGPSGVSRSLEAAQRDLFVIGTDGTGDRNLTATPETERNPAWSPDGAFLAFEQSIDGAANRLATLGMDGPAPVGAPNLGPESEWFVWSPDGRQLLWQELVTSAPETFRSTVHAIDREFLQPSATLQVVDGLIVCPPTWQRLDR